jgi:hypothetical protein
LATNLGHSLSGSDVVLTWDNQSLPHVHTECDPPVRLNNSIQRSADNTSWTTIATISATATTYTDTNRPNGTWYYRVGEAIRSFIDFGFGCQSVDNTSYTGSISVFVGNAPDPFTFPSITGAEQGVLTASATRSISGLNTSPAAISLNTYTNAQWRKRVGGTWQAWQSTSGTIANGDMVQVRMNAPSWADSRTITLTIGDFSTGFTVTTRSDPGGVVDAPTSGEISFANLRQMWGPQPNVNVTLFDYRRGGSRLQDLPQNDHVPTAAPISLSDFYGCRGEWRLNPLPNEVGSVDAASATASASLVTGYDQPIEYRWTPASTPAGTSWSGAALNAWSTSSSLTLNRGSSELAIVNASLQARPVGSSTAVSVGTVTFRVGTGL